MAAGGRWKAERASSAATANRVATLARGAVTSGDPGDPADPGDLGDPGDPGAGYHWTCALCRHPAGSVDPAGRVATAVNSISEKFELVNRVQLPRLSSDLTRIRSTTERIARQNESILKYIEELRGREPKRQGTRGYRKRKITLAPKAKPPETDATPTRDRLARHRPRRSLTLQDLLLVLNRKIHQTPASSKQR
ncbi:unnamed protein product, partial [Iphiclides podalirius]